MTTAGSISSNIMYDSNNILSYKVKPRNFKYSNISNISNDSNTIGRESPDRASPPSITWLKATLQRLKESLNNEK